MEREEILGRLKQAEMVLVGLGREFDPAGDMGSDAAFAAGRELLQESGARWLLPAWGDYCAGQAGAGNKKGMALEKLAGLLSGKNYFVVSVSTSGAVASFPGDGNRLVMPCGNGKMKQCAGGCEGQLRPVTEEDSCTLDGFFRELWLGHFPSGGAPELGKCEVCGKPLILNNVYADVYDESGYLPGWRRYTKWLQGTLNRELFVLELGVDLEFPSVVRWPFEKVAIYNRKAFLCRINERLYQLPEELSSKGCGISKNAIDWLSQL